jgi:probable F420-dependent oxidoreductase
MAFTGLLGLVFPQDKVGESPASIIDFVKDVEVCGIDYLAAAHHDLGLDPNQHGGALGRDWPFPEPSQFRSVAYNAGNAFHEPFVLFGFLSGVCGLSFLTSALILPQRQTVAVAKAAAEVDLLSGGRFTLGVGAGWNSTEMTMAGMPWPDRFARMEEQIHLLRELWTKSTVSFEGRYHRLSGAGILPHPVQQSIPIWIGSGSGPLAIDRVARLADGWMPQQIPGSGLNEALRRLHVAIEKWGRDPDSLALHGVVTGDGVDIARVVRQTARWDRLGATHLAIDLRGSPDADRKTIYRAVEAIRSG